MVFHLAALGSVPRSVEKPMETHLVNVDGTLNLLLAARDAGVRRFVFASSSSVYGDTTTLPKHEELPATPASPYGISKLAAELYSRVFGRVYGLETISLRYFNVFGSQQDPQSQYAAVIPKFISRILGGESPLVFGDGNQSRDFTYVENVVEANILAMKAAHGFGETFNIAMGGRVTVNDLAGRLMAILETSVAIAYADGREGDIRHSFAAVDKARQILSYTPIIEFDEGLRRTVAWYRDAIGTANEEDGKSSTARR